MKRGTIRTITAGGETMQAAFLGEGMFCKAWRVVDTDRVILFTGEDLAKDIVASCEPIPHLPRCQRIDGADDPEYIFEMPYYTPLTAAHMQAWADYRALEKCWKEQSAKHINHKNPLRWNAFLVNAGIAEHAPVSPALREALCELAARANEWGVEYAFEFTKRNLCVDAEGNLILLDVVFNAESVWKIREADDKKRRGW